MTEGGTGPLVVVVAYRSDDMLPALVSPLRPRLRVVVVDNGSSEVTRAIVQKLDAEYLDAGGNVGFAAGVNSALEHSWDGRQDVLLLNPDASLSVDEIAALHQALWADEALAAVGPRLIGIDGRAQRADWPLPSPCQVWFDALALSRLWRGPRFVVGAALLLRGAALRDLGGLDERYFLYAEEADWQLRAQRAGWRVTVVDDVAATHVGGASSGNPLVRDRFFYASGDEFARHWYGRSGQAIMRAAMIVAAARRSVVGSPAGRIANRRALRLHLGMLPRRGSDTHEVAARQRRVVHVVRSDGFAGVERYIADVANELAGRGWSVAVIGGDPERMRSELSPDVRFHPARTLPQVLTRLISMRPVDVVHAHMTAAEVPAALLKRWLRGTLVVTRHFAAVRGRSRTGRLARAFVARRIDTQIAISEFVAQQVDGDSVVIPNGVPPSDSATTERGRTVVVMQRLELEKDSGTALRAWSEGKLADHGWQLLIFGQGAEHAALVSLADTLGISGSVEFRGFTDRPREALRSAGLVLATAPAEPFGLAVVEAMAESTLIVAADGGAHRETLGEDGVMFEPGDALDCAKHLSTLIADESLRRRLGKAMRTRHDELFTLTHHVDQLLEVYR